MQEYSATSSKKRTIVNANSSAYPISKLSYKLIVIIVLAAAIFNVMKPQ